MWLTMPTKVAAPRYLDLVASIRNGGSRDLRRLIRIRLEDGGLPYRDRQRAGPSFPATLPTNRYNSAPRVK
jgi:hypothetical protein